MAWSKLVDLAFDEDDKADMAAEGMCAPANPLKDQPEYPWGLRISLTQKELTKLKLKADCEVGDLIDMRCFGLVTSVSSSQMADGSTQDRVEIQIQKVAIEDENREGTPGDD